MSNLLLKILFSLNASSHYMMKSARRIQAWLSRHAPSVRKNVACQNASEPTSPFSPQPQVVSLDRVLFFDGIFNGQALVGRKRLPDGIPGAVVPVRSQLVFDGVENMIGKHRDKHMGIRPPFELVEVRTKSQG